MKRAFAIILAVMLLVLPAVMSACDNTVSKTGDVKTSGGSAAPTTGTAPVTTEVKEILPDIPEGVTYPDTTFTILNYCLDSAYETSSYDFYVSEERDGELINDAARERINQVEEKFGIKIENVPSNDPETLLKTAVGSGLDTYDIALLRINKALEIAQNGTLVDLNTIEYIDLEKPWWDQHSVRDLSIAGKTYIATGDISNVDEQLCVCIFINKTLAEEKNLPDIYKAFEENKWTVDTMHEYVKDASEDLNGDGAYDTNDCWGMASASNSAFLFLNSFGASFAELDENGKPVITLGSTRAAEAVAKIVEVYNDKQSIIWADGAGGGWSNINKMVTDGKICLIPANIYKFSTYIIMEDDFGVLPLPKLDSEQENYIHQVFTHAAQGLVVPTTCSDFDKVGIITEYLAYLGNKIMVPAYYDSYLLGRVSRDIQSEKSFDIIFSTKKYDIGYAYNWQGIAGTIQQAIGQNGGFASIVDTKLEAAQKDADDLYEKFLSSLD